MIRFDRGINRFQLSSSRLCRSSRSLASVRREPFTHDEKPYHEIALYFLMRETQGHLSARARYERYYECSKPIVGLE
jgi:hypothetical protein